MVPKMISNNTASSKLLTEPKLFAISPISCLLEVWEWAVLVAIWSYICPPGRDPGATKITRNSVIFLPHNEFRLFLDAWEWRRLAFSILRLIKTWSALGLPTFDLCQQNPAIKAASWFVSTNVVLKRHLASGSDETTHPTSASHNQRILWEWISSSTSSDFSGIWFSFKIKMNPSDWLTNQRGVNKEMLFQRSNW